MPKFYIKVECGYLCGLYLNLNRYSSFSDHKFIDQLEHVYQIWRNIGPVIEEFIVECKMWHQYVCKVPKIRKHVHMYVYHLINVSIGDIYNLSIPRETPNTVGRSIHHRHHTIPRTMMKEDETHLRCFILVFGFCLE